MEAGAGAFVTTYLSPQWSRMVGHYALASAWIIPSVFLLLLKEGQNRRGKWDFLLLFLIGLAGYYTHPYLGMMITLMGGAWWGISLLFQGIKRSYWKTFLAVLLSLIWYNGHVQLTDIHPNRFPNPWGFFANQSRFESVFLPLLGPLSKWVTWAGRPWEGWAYVGLITDLAFLYLIVRIGRKWYWILKKRKRLTWSFLGSGIPKELWMLGFVGVVLLFISFGTGFNLSEKSIQYLGPLKHFRSLGRFAWVFYYVAIPFAFFIWFRFSRACPTWQRPIWLFVIILIYGIEGFYHHDLLQFAFGKENARNQFQEPDDHLKKIIENIRKQRVEVLIPFPFSMNGSEVFGTHGEGRIFVDQFLLAYHTGVPMRNIIASRTSLTEVEQFYRLFSPLKDDRKKALESVDLDDTVALVIDVTHLRPIEWDFLTSIRYLSLEKIPPYVVGITTFRNLLLAKDVTYPAFSSQWIIQQREDTLSVPPYQDYPLMSFSDSLIPGGKTIVFEYHLHYDSIFKEFAFPSPRVSLSSGEVRYVEQRNDMALKGSWVMTNTLLPIREGEGGAVIMHHAIPKEIRFSGMKLYAMPSISLDEGFAILNSCCK
jgi:hypothetical protein